MQKKFPAEVTQLLEDAGHFAEQGKREKAYQFCLQATSVAPNEPRAWYLRSQMAPSVEEKVMCLSRAYSLDPEFPDTKKELRDAIQALLKQEPFLAYVYETEEFYQVRSGREMLINIPKNRTFEKSYLQKDPGPLKPAFRWLSVSLLALVLGGVGAVLLAPVAAFQALRLHSQARSRPDRIRSWVVLTLSLMIWLAAIPISWLLLIRLSP